MLRIKEIQKCKYEIEFYERQLQDKEFEENWDACEELIAYWKERLERVMKGETK